MAQKMFGH